jgi:uncharacterized RDD family membrane protein YckC
METTQHSGQEESIFSDELHNLVDYEQASQGQRALNWIIDTSLMRWGLSYLTSTLVWYIISVISPDYIIEFYEGERKVADLLLLNYLVFILNCLTYYTICEKAFRGYTLGKLITGTRAIRNDGDELTFKDALLRSVSRLVPLEVLSGFAQSPLHDVWTKTTVIRSR